MRKQKKKTPQNTNKNAHIASQRLFTNVRETYTSRRESGVFVSCVTNSNTNRTVLNVQLGDEAMTFSGRELRTVLRVLQSHGFCSVFHGRAADLAVFPKKHR